MDSCVLFIIQQLHLFTWTERICCWASYFLCNPQPHSSQYCTAYSTQTKLGMATAIGHYDRYCTTSIILERLKKNSTAFFPQSLLRCAQAAGGTVTCSHGRNTLQEGPSTEHAGHLTTRWLLSLDLTVSSNLQAWQQDKCLQLRTTTLASLMLQWRQRPFQPPGPDRKLRFHILCLN